LEFSLHTVIAYRTVSLTPHELLCAAAHEPKETPMISLLEDIQNRLDAGALLLNLKTKKPDGRGMFGRLYLSGGE
jgi:hypothetical protein